MSRCSSSNEDLARQNLTDRLLDAVKQCQIRFGGKTELATDNDSRVSCLCAQWESVLQFGIKSNKKINPLRHVAGQVLLRPEGDSVLWQFIKEHLNPTEIKRFNTLENITTDVGRARSWLRSTLNEQSLEKYLHTFLANKQLLSSYYETSALIMDEERSTMLPMMAAGLSSILFAISIDNAEINTSKSLMSASNTSTQSGLLWNAPSPVYSAPLPEKAKKKRKKKKTNVAFPSIENIEDSDNTEENIDQPTDNAFTSQPSYGEQNIEQINVLQVPRTSNNIHKVNSASSIKSNGGQSDREEPLVELSSGVSLTPVICDHAEDNMVVNTQEHGSHSGSNSSDNESPITSVSNDLSDDLSLSSSVISSDHSANEDTNLAINATEAALSAVQDVHREMTDFYTRSSLVRTMGDGRTSPTQDSGNTKEMTSAELKQAIVSMMLRKDEVEECNRSLRQLLDKEMCECTALRHEVDELKKEKVLSQETQQATKLALSSENDLLKHQLKKYVAAVQSLRKNNTSEIVISGSQAEKSVDSSPETSSIDNASDDGTVYERKLIQMADMHSELIELNERLQKMLSVREHQLRSLRQELINLRGPLPEDATQDDSYSLEQFGPCFVPVNTRPLINIWIPSAFAQGKSSDAHHTYQVYVRIKDDEWNVYRRYSHFYDMHKKLCKQYSEVTNFKFPQKKVIGNRDSKFVETRRRHLQSYLRKLINHSLKIISELSESPSKSLLLKYFPFFGSSNGDSIPDNTTPGNTRVYTGL